MTKGSRSVLSGATAVSGVAPPALPEELLHKLPPWAESGEGVAQQVEDIIEQQDEEAEEQVFPSHQSCSERFQKTLYYGGLNCSELPSTERFSFSLTRLCADAFQKATVATSKDCQKHCTSVLDCSCPWIRPRQLDRLDVCKASRLSKATAASPTSLVVALIYLDRLRSKKSTYLATVSSTDLFLVSLMVACKFLYDDGEDDEVFNDEWASAGDMETKELNRKELAFLNAMDWSIYVTQMDFVEMRRKVEYLVARREVLRKGWASYTDLVVLTKGTNPFKIWQMIMDCTIKVTAVCAAAYAASVMAMLGTVCLLRETPLGQEGLRGTLSGMLILPPAANLDPRDKGDVGSLNGSSAATAARQAPAGQPQQRLAIQDLPDSTCDAPDAAAASFVLASLAAAATTAVAAEKGDKDQTSKSRLKQDRSSRGSVVFGSLDGNVTDVMIEDEGGGAETLDDVRVPSTQSSLLLSISDQLGARHSTSVLLSPNEEKEEDKENLLPHKSIKLMSLWQAQVQNGWNFWESLDAPPAISSQSTQCPLRWALGSSHQSTLQQQQLVHALMTGVA